MSHHIDEFIMMPYRQNYRYRNEPEILSNPPPYLRRHYDMDKANISLPKNIIVYICGNSKCYFHLLFEAAVLSGALGSDEGLLLLPEKSLPCPTSPNCCWAIIFVSIDIFFSSSTFCKAAFA